MTLTGMRQQKPGPFPAVSENDRKKKEEEGGVERAIDTNLVRQFLGGDPKAFDSLVRRYEGRLTRFVYRSTGDEEKAEDLVQETFLRVYLHVQNFDLTKKFSTWIYTIASNLAKNELRNRSREFVILLSTLEGKLDSDKSPQFADLRLHPEILMRGRELRTLFEKATSQLSVSHRQVFVLREFEGREYEEIARIIGCPLGTVKSRLNRARNQFATILRPHLT
jgi:RNA polymerase sigma-70 factor, ECF subfamily